MCFGYEIVKKLVYPASLAETSNLELRIILQKAFPDAQLILSDLHFHLTDLTEAQRFCTETKVSTWTYVPENHDCENFSYALMGRWSEAAWSFAFGIAHSNVHAFNWLVDCERNVWIVEPQTNKFLTIEEAKLDNQYCPVKLIMC